MNDNFKLISKIEELEREIALLPIGSIAVKKINDKNYYYHRFNVGNKRKEEYISFDEVDSLKESIYKRKKLEKELNKLKKKLPTNKSLHLSFETNVRVGEELRRLVSGVKNYKKRTCFEKLRDYLSMEYAERVFILYGLRRTGKTTLIKQAILDLNEEDFSRTAFIQITQKDAIESLNKDLRTLDNNNYKYIFIDEVTLLKDFIDTAAIFSDIFVSGGMKIVLSGTDSLGFLFANDDQLYDRSIMLHTTFIPYYEFERVLGVKGIDEYIKYGGTMSLSGNDYNCSSIFSNYRKCEEYIDTAIAKNIQHSLKLYRDGGHFRSLSELYERNELTNVINRVIEDVNHSFAKKVIEKTFSSSDISITSKNLIADKTNQIDLKSNLKLKTLEDNIKHVLEILNKEEQTIEISDEHIDQIKEYLFLLDLIAEIDERSIPFSNSVKKNIVFTQPGMRYAQAKVIVENILEDEKFNELDIRSRKQIIDRLLSEICGRMMEEIVLLETKLVNTEKEVFKLTFAVGEFYMVVCDKEKLECEIFEIKHSTEIVERQCQHLNDQNKLDVTEHYFGTIKRKAVIYRGKETTVGDITYLNVENYLNSLYKFNKNETN